MTTINVNEILGVWSLVMGVCVCIVGGMNVLASIDYGWPVSTFVFSLALVLFGFLLINAFRPLSGVLRYFGFMAVPAGRGFFMLFVGLVCLPHVYTSDHWFESATGFLTALLGFVHLLFAFIAACEGGQSQGRGREAMLG